MQQLSECCNCLKYDENIYECTWEIFLYSAVIGKVMAETGEAEIELLQFYRWGDVSKKWQASCSYYNT